MEKVSILPRDEATEYYRALLILSGLRGLAKRVQQEARMVFGIDLSENEVLGPAYLQGRAEGEHDGQLALLRRQIERRFGALPDWAEQKLSQMSAQDLEAVGIRVLDATGLEDLFH